MCRKAYCAWDIVLYAITSFWLKNSFASTLTWFSLEVIHSSSKSNKTQLQNYSKKKSNNNLKIPLSDQPYLMHSKYVISSFCRFFQKNWKYLLSLFIFCQLCAKPYPLLSIIYPLFRRPKLCFTIYILIQVLSVLTKHVLMTCMKWSYTSH